MYLIVDEEVMLLSGTSSEEKLITLTRESGKTFTEKKGV